MIPVHEDHHPIPLHQTLIFNKKKFNKKSLEPEALMDGGGFLDQSSLVF